MVGAENDMRGSIDECRVVGGGAGGVQVREGGREGEAMRCLFWLLLFAGVQDARSQTVCLSVYLRCLRLGALELEAE